MKFIQKLNKRLAEGWEELGISDPNFPQEVCYICNCTNGVRNCTGNKKTNKTYGPTALKRCDSFMCQEHSNQCPYCNDMVCSACLDDHIFSKV